MNRWGVANDRLNKLYRRLCVTGATCWKAVWCCSHRLPGRDIYILPAVCTPPPLLTCILYTGLKSIEVCTAIIKLARLQYYDKNIYSICGIWRCAWYCANKTWLKVLFFIEIMLPMNVNAVGKLKILLPKFLSTSRQKTKVSKW